MMDPQDILQYKIKGQPPFGVSYGCLFWRSQINIVAYYFRRYYMFQLNRVTILPINECTCSFLPPTNTLSDKPVRWHTSL